LYGANFQVDYTLWYKMTRDI